MSRGMSVVKRRIPMGMGKLTSESIAITSFSTRCKGSGKLDALYLFKDGRLIREERDTDGDGYFDVRIFYENEQLLRNEADTNSDRRVDVWAFYKDGQLVRQDEDLNFNGRISARYYFKDGKVIKEEKVADEQPWGLQNPFPQSKRN
jgi:antitoxin component YwqK of YwqJK toxin-antitoxin module